MALPHVDEPTRTLVERRLRDADIFWLTTVRADGQPQASPVGFVWDGERFLILSQPRAPKVANLGANPKVALHLDIDREDEAGGVLTFEGVAEVAAEPLSEEERSAYLAKYLDVIEAQDLTPDEVLADYSTPIRITPTRVRTA
jgi:PPOX class probable F420-dependent enzyme